MLLKAREPIRFRNKFVKLIENPNLLSKLDQIIFSLCLRPEKYIENLLWSLTLNPEDALMKMGLCIGANYQAENEVPEHIIIPLRNEIRYQYKLSHPNFFQVKIPTKCEKAFIEMKGAVQSDDIVSKVIWDFSVATVMEKQEFEIERITYLLSSKKEPNVHGGLRAMHFTVQEAKFLQPYAKEIAKLIDAITLVEKSAIKTISTKCVKVDFVKFGEQSKKEQLNGVDQTESTSESQATKKSTVIKEETIKSNLKLFTSFLDSCQSLRQLGITPEEVLKNEQDVRQTLNSLQELKQA